MNVLKKMLQNKAVNKNNIGCHFKFCKYDTS